MNGKQVGIICGAALLSIMPPVMSYAQGVSGVGEFIPDMWSKISAAGPFATALMIYLWTRSEAERRKLQDERDGLLERVLKVVSDNTESNRDLRIGLFGGVHERQE
jgi:hypothetical protein